MVARVFYSVIFTLIFSVAQAQTMLSRADVMRLAERSASVEVARARLASVEAQAADAGVGLSGSVTGSAAVVSTVPTAGASNFTYPWDIQFNLRFAGIWGEAQDARVQASLNLERAKRSLLAARVRAITSAVSLWHGIRRGLANLEVARLALDLATLEDRAAEARFQAGGITVVDRERFSIAVDIATLDVTRAEVRLDGLRLQFEALFGVRNPTIKQGWTGLPEPRVTEAQLEAREDVFEARAAAIGAGIQQSQAQREVLPVVSLEGNWRGSAGEFNWGVNQYLAVSLGYSYPIIIPIGVSQSFSIGLSLRIPLNPWKFSSVSAFSRQVSAAQRSLDTAIAIAKADISNKRAALALTRSSLQLALRSAEYAARQVERIRVRVSAGTASVVDVKRAELDALKANAQILEAQFETDAAILDICAAYAFPLEAQ